MSEDTFIDDVKKRDRQRQLYEDHLAFTAGFLDGLASRLESWRSDPKCDGTIEDLRAYSEMLKNLPGIEMDIETDQ